MIHVRGLALWSPSYADLAAFRAGAIAESAEDPPLVVENPRAWRGTSRLTRMLAHVVKRTASEAALDLPTTPIVYASAWGEIDIMIQLLGQIADGELGLSPLRFKHSVHNAASGAVSIAANNRELTTAIAAGLRTFECGLLEALAVLKTGVASEVILAVGEDELPPPLDRFGSYEGLAVAMCLSTREGPGHGGRLGWPERRAPSVPVTEVAERYRGNPTALALPLIAALGQASPSWVAVSDAATPYVVEARS